MTENRKTILMIAFATVLSVVALVYGFSSIPNPAQQRDLKLDHRRVSDLGELQLNIDEYYRNNNQLPDSLAALSANTYNTANPQSRTDPQTNEAYEYSIKSPSKYQLCATFITDSNNEKYAYDEENYNYENFRLKFKHPQGRYCFDLDAPPTPYPSPTFYLLNPTMPVISPSQLPPVKK